MRRLLISLDMEGIAGVASATSLMPSGWEYPAYRKWMTGELNAVAEAAFEAGYDEVVASDGHGNAQNLDPDLLADNIRLIRSWPRPFMQMEMIDDPGVEACAFVGYHASAGTADSILAHSFSGAAFRSVKLNGEVASEGYFNAALAGAFDKPVLFISGDDSTLEDARRYAPNAGMIATKASFGFRSQMALPPAQTCRVLKQAAADAFLRTSSEPFKLASPFVVDLEMTSQVAPELLGYLPWIERLDAWTVRAEFSAMPDAIRFIAFAVLYQPNGQTPF
ncbi:M55 family metallopeptidase [Kineobactrum salinum]|uniref:M55 family metallopeptidase n=1 Tax=Kineobactrum salinum TaxID=2708301 RepID=A0A6C0U7P7_9GAMM|nr:M55 family metallopeptidase [Kineobactrum salinum]QIB67007.1 M55 family metallopeptidase [Kineobactrum salinum]